MKLYSYIVARDFGFAPNPFYGFCTLATCKPKIREHASVGDWVVGTGARSSGRTTGGTTTTVWRARGGSRRARRRFRLRRSCSRFP